MNEIKISNDEHISAEINSECRLMVDAKISSENHNPYYIPRIYRNNSIVSLSNDVYSKICEIESGKTIIIYKIISRYSNNVYKFKLVLDGVEAFYVSSTNLKLFKSIKYADENYTPSKLDVQLTDGEKELIITNKLTVNNKIELYAAGDGNTSEFRNMIIFYDEVV